MPLWSCVVICDCTFRGKCASLGGVIGHPGGVIGHLTLVYGVI